jgi:hypothetical protein
MKMTISSLLGWGGKRKADDERRKRARVVLDGPLRAYWCVDGQLDTLSGTLRDAAEDGSGIGFSLRRQIPIGTVAWLNTKDGHTFGGVVRHANEKEGEFRTGIQLDLQPKGLSGWGGVQTSWVDADGNMNAAPASLRNSEEGRLQVNAVGEAAEGSLLLITGTEVSCLCLVNGCQPYGKRFLLDVETVADATPQQSKRAA